MNKGCELQKLIRCYSDNVDDQLIQFSRISQVEFSGRTRLFLVTYLKTLLCKVKDEASLATLQNIQISKVVYPECYSVPIWKLFYCLVPVWSMALWQYKHCSAIKPHNHVIASTHPPPALPSLGLRSPASTLLNGSQWWCGHESKIQISCREI